MKEEFFRHKSSKYSSPKARRDLSIEQLDLRKWLELVNCS